VRSVGWSVAFLRRMLWLVSVLCRGCLSMSTVGVEGPMAGERNERMTGEGNAGDERK
jgi:hypothetical protein